nr:hypothetical protein [Hyphomonas sp. Mor2]
MTDFNRYALLLAALGQFLAPALPSLGFGESIGARAVADGIPPELPIGIFFAIWSVIFLGFFAMALLHLQKPDHATRQVAAPLALAGFGNVIWMISAQSIGSVWLDFLLLLPIGFFAWEAAYRLDQTQTYDGSLRSVLYGVTVGMLAGWLTVAVSISVPDVGRWLLGRGPSDAVWQSLWMTLVPAVILATVFANHVSRSGWYFVALGWGLLGIVVNNWTRLETHALAIAAAIVGVYILFRRIRFGASGSYPAKP